ncbi:fimbrillin family protein, partial [Phocaeicola oris]|uniref:fimbrillin family protein n=1 Tax=Phocaeicola oris TaxID=2896850 RepID=UPI00234E9828
MKLTKLLLWSGMLTSLGMLTSCANDDLGKGRQTDGDKGVAVTFNVSDVRDKANNATSPDGAVTRAAFAERLVVQNLTPEDLTSRKLSVAGADDACLIETTVAGVPSTRTNGKAQTRANITTTATLGNFSSIGYRGTASGNLETTPWFYNEETDSNGELSTPKQWSWGKRYGKFFAVAPQVTADYTKLTLSPQSHTSTPYVNFEVEPDVKNQKDLMTACSGEVHYAEWGSAPTTNLTFRHALTAV